MLVVVGVVGGFDMIVGAKGGGDGLVVGLPPDSKGSLVGGGEPTFPPPIPPLLPPMFPPIGGRGLCVLAVELAWLLVDGSGTAPEAGILRALCGPCIRIVNSSCLALQNDEEGK